MILRFRHKLAGQKGELAVPENKGGLWVETHTNDRPLRNTAVITGNQFDVRVVNRKS